MTTTEESARILQGFLSRFDGDADDVVTRAEIEAALAGEGVDAPTAALIADQIMANWDNDGSGALSRGEAVRLAEKWASFPGDQSA